MPEEFDPISVFNRAAVTAKDRYVESVRHQRDEEIRRPLVGERKTPEERRMAFLMNGINPDVVMSIQDEMTARFNLKDGMVPKRLAEYLDNGYKEALEHAEKEQRG